MVERFPTTDAGYYVLPPPQCPAISDAKRAETRLPFRQANLPLLPEVAAIRRWDLRPFNVTNSCRFVGCAACAGRAWELLEAGRSSRIRFRLERGTQGDCA